MERSHLAALLALLLCVCCAASPSASKSSASAYFCPEDCNCTLSQHTHTPTLHAKCSSTRGLQYSEQPLPANVPIHSIDLSFLGLTRLEHVLDMLPNLTSVDLSHNELHELGHLSKLIKKLNLKHNRLTSEKLLKLPQHLTVLNLQHNDITYLPKELTHLYHLEHLELGHNPINCSCSTLEVRNWLQERNMYMQKPVVCHQPREAYGKSWLQIRQAEICGRHYSWLGDENDSESDNELMMADQPADNEEPEEEEEELGKDFMVIDGKKAPKPAHEPVAPEVSDVEGSGDLTETNMELLAAPPAPQAQPLTDAQQQEHQQDEASNDLDHDNDNDNDEGSGSGGGPIIVPRIHSSGSDSVDDFEPPDSQGAEQAHKHDEEEEDESFDSKPVEQPTSGPIVFPNNFNIFTDDKQPAQQEEEKSLEEQKEEIIVPVVQTKLDSEQTPDVITDGPLDADKPSDDILAAKIGKKDDSNAIYFLLGVIALIVVGLILFVAIKRCKYNRNAAARDLEAQRVTELLDMDKKNLGKPLARNGHEQAPLIGDKSKVDDAQISPRASKYAQHASHGDGGEPNNNNNNNNNEPDAAYLPSSPKSGRYSPVYSPETGRVKIKLTETPKPKTPMLVTRSKSNAGDIITTPVHQAPALAAGGGANGVASH
ncbi:hypothetical protein KR093_001004 [Drosophila rubida]|uniref:Protein windpipe n=1 Tax=Drosophila rubida TaxID=30044 RepID=A0AAD4PJA6_9MUSC|nr:hypothetical protein KR093_001004 [Drosophila rubida]